MSTLWTPSVHDRGAAMARAARSDSALSALLMNGT
jgi:hypothetical protein